jgi:cytoskeletal protein CcmA (bactofilin family)
MFKEDDKKQAGGQDTVVAQGVKVEGDFKSHGNIVIEGEVHGTIRTERDLTVGEQARIVANVWAENATISGEVQGNMKISERLELTPTSRITGDVQAKTVSVAPGAIMNGKCTMPGGPDVAAVPAPASKKRGRAKAATLVEAEELQAS